jgi:hypothetical protein
MPAKYLWNRKPSILAAQRRAFFNHRRLAVAFLRERERLASRAIVQLKRQGDFHISVSSDSITVRSAEPPDAATNVRQIPQQAVLLASVVKSLVFGDRLGVLGPINQQ